MNRGRRISMYSDDSDDVETMYTPSMRMKKKMQELNNLLSQFEDSAGSENSKINRRRKFDTQIKRADENVRKELTRRNTIEREPLSNENKKWEEALKARYLRTTAPRDFEVELSATQVFDKNHHEILSNGGKF